MKDSEIRPLPLLSICFTIPPSSNEEGERFLIQAAFVSKTTMPLCNCYHCFKEARYELIQGEKFDRMAQKVYLFYEQEVDRALLVQNPLS